MNRAVAFLLTLLLSIVVFETVVGIYIMETELKWRYYYEYVDLSGKVGRSSNCYEERESTWCRNAKGVFKVATYTQKRERR